MSVTHITNSRRPIPCVCMCKNSSQTTEPICIKNYTSKIERLTLIAVGYLDLKYLPNTMNIVTESAPLLHRRIFANGNVLRDVIGVISVTIGVFRNKPRMTNDE